MEITVVACYFIHKHLPILLLSVVLKELTNWQCSYPFQPEINQ